MKCSPLAVIVALCGVACTPDFPEPFWTGSYLAYSTTTSAEKLKRRPPLTTLAQRLM